MHENMFAGRRHRAMRMSKELHTKEFKVARFQLLRIWKPDFKRSLVQAVPDLSAPWYRCDP